MAETTTVTLAQPAQFKLKALQWASYFKTVCLLDSNGYANDAYTRHEWVLAADALDEVEANHQSPEKLKQFQASAGSPIFGFLGYDLKNELEELSSTHPTGVPVANLYFFKPRYLLQITSNRLTLNRNYPETFELVELINNLPLNETTYAPLTLQARTPKQRYLQNVERIKQQIANGDFYEMNYCVELYAENARINPVQVFNRLNLQAQAPFSCFVKWRGNYLLCASPERFLQKKGEQVVSQPIKGTIGKGATPAEDEALKEQLKNDPKERAENVMIVDLVRNDLAKNAVPGSVQVPELFGVYGFNTVNQLISTITAQLKEGVHFTDVLKGAFPMGSMTGAPKVMAMKTIEQYEDFKRGLYSGAVGYITPETDFDFNVVIRCVLYNETTGYVSVPVGGAITYGSVAENEYKEIWLKARYTLQALNATAKEN